MTADARKAFRDPRLFAEISPSGHDGRYVPLPVTSLTKAGSHPGNVAAPRRPHGRRLRSYDRSEGRSRDGEAVRAWPDRRRSLRTQRRTDPLSSHFLITRYRLHYTKVFADETTCCGLNVASGSPAPPRPAPARRSARDRRKRFITYRINSKKLGIEQSLYNTESYHYGASVYRSLSGGNHLSLSFCSFCVLLKPHRPN